MPAAERNSADHLLWIAGITGLDGVKQISTRRSNGLVVHQGRDKAQEGLMLRVQRPPAEKGPDVEIGYTTA